ncbi:MAG TPA: serine/threonine-protein kinase [Kofleriaceae bacterium]|nr:serine/threonine-protein kinase [Kofleriaceae bacterium]
MTPEPRKSGMLELPRGTAIGKYEILRKLATGGMAEIYLARVSGTAGFEKLVVLKRILPTIAEDPKLVQMFLDEARLAATLRHPNIADVYDVGDDDGVVFYTMEFVHGQDVRTMRQDAKRKNEAIPLGVALAIVHGTASALEHAHELAGPDGKPLGLVHRDVSTSNVMVSYDGAIKLLDFGIARATSSTHKTQTGMLKGKVAYMSPEQCKGTPLDRRSDLFSLGIVMFELTVGRRPFRGDTDFAIMDQIVYQGAPTPSSIRQGYPAELEAIVMKLLDPNPAMRYPTAEDLLHDIDEYVGKQGLWQSPRAIGKFMRSLFAEKIAAWEQAEQDGVPFEQHVVQSITSESRRVERVELVTPSVSFAGVEPRPSQRHMLGHAPTAVQASVEMPAPAVREPVPEPAAPLPMAKLESGPAVYPALKPSIVTTIFRVLLALIVLGAAGVGGFILTQNRTGSAAKDETAEPSGETPTETKSGETKVDEAKADTKSADEAKAAQEEAEAAKARAEAAKADAAKAEQAKAEAKAEQAKAEQANAQAKAELKAAQAKAEQVKAEAAKAEQKAKAEQAKIEAAKAQQAKADKLKAEQLAKAQKGKRTKKTTKTDKTDETKVEPAKQDPNKPFDPDSPFLPQ